jgi:signal transduction histidine kinase
LLVLVSAALAGALPVAVALLLLDGSAASLAGAGMVSLVALALLAGSGMARLARTTAASGTRHDVAPEDAASPAAASSSADRATAIVHDLRAPLVTVHSYLELLTEEAFGPIPREAKQAAHRAALAAGRAQELVEETLRSYAVEVAGQPLDRSDRPGQASQPGRAMVATTSRVELSSLVNGVVASLDAEIRASGARIEVRALSAVCGHGAALYRVFANLLENSLKYAAPGEPPHVTVSCDVDGGRCEVVVRDRGIGIPAE